MSLFAEAARKAAKVRFRQPQLDAEGQEVEVGCTHEPFTREFCTYNYAAALCATLNILSWRLEMLSLLQ